MNLYKLILAVFVVFVGILLFADKYEAKAEYRVRVLNIEHKETKETKQVLHVVGDYDDGITKDVTKLLDMYPNVDFATLHSPGGNGNEAYDMARLFSDRKVTTRVARGTFCLSSCAIAFMGGWNYQIDGGILGFHRGWLPKADDLDANITFQEGQAFGAYSMVFFLTNGFSAQLAYAVNTQTTPTKFIVFTNADTFNEEYVRGKDDKTPINDYFKFDTLNYQYFEGKDFVNYLNNNPNLGEYKVQDILKEYTNEKANNDG